MYRFGVGVPVHSCVDVMVVLACVIVILITS